VRRVFPVAEDTNNQGLAKLGTMASYPPMMRILASMRRSQLGWRQ